MTGDDYRTKEFKAKMDFCKDIVKIVEEYNWMKQEQAVTVELVCNCWDEDFIKPNIQGMCGNCGQTVYDHAKYCSECGMKLEWK